MNVNAAIRQMKTIFQCAKDADVFGAVFINFGTLLAYVRNRELFSWDHDFDICVRSDWLTKSEENKFHEILVKANIFKVRARPRRRSDTDRFIYNSMQSEQPGCRNCMWWMFPWGKHLYHCKGKRWLKKIGLKPPIQRALPAGTNLDKSETFIKGNTLRCFDSMLTKKWYGFEINIPIGYGQLLTEYYGDWAVPRVGGASARYRVVLIGNWSKQSTWMVIEE